MGILAGRVFTSLTKRDQNVLWQRNGIEHPRKAARVFDGEQEKRRADLLDQLGRGLWFYCLDEFKVKKGSGQFVVSGDMVAPALLVCVALRVVIGVCAASHGVNVCDQGCRDRA